MGAPRPRIAVEAWAGEGHSTRRLALFYDRVIAFEPVERLHDALVRTLEAEGYDNVTCLRGSFREMFPEIMHTIPSACLFYLRGSEEIGAAADLPFPIAAYVEAGIGPFDLHGRTHNLIREENRFVMVSR
jgi:hypothetical protein